MEIMLIKGNGVVSVRNWFAGWLYSKLEAMQKKPDIILYNSAVREDLQTLEPAGDTPKRQKDYVIKKLSVCSLIVACGVVLSIVLWIKDGMGTKIVDNQLERNVYGGGKKSVTLLADDGESSYQIPVTLSEKCYTQEELAKMSDEVINVLEKLILGANESFDKIEYNMNLVNSVEGYPFTVEWRTDDVYMDYTGKLVQDTLAAPVLTELTAVLSCDSYEIERDMAVNIHSKAIQPGTAERLARQISWMEEESRTRQNMTLPSKSEDKNLHWSYKRNYRGLLFLAATPVLAVLIYYGKDRDLHRKVVDREEQMRMDYPEIVSSLALLLGAGMTVPNAWNKIARDYKRRREEGGGRRYAYEEMLLTIYEMESGVVQAKAYERFGRRCRIPSYNKLSTMLSQNIRKGTANLPLLLKEEATDAFEERKHTARKLGEKAGTKLLVPMMMLLGITMVIIMVPAFQTYF